jgi:hypothetical protein
VDLGQHVKKRLVHGRCHPPVLQEALEPLLLEVEIQLRNCACLERTGTSSKRLQEKVEEDLCQHLPLLVQPPVEEPQPPPRAGGPASPRVAARGCGGGGAGQGLGTRADLGGAAMTGQGRAGWGGATGSRERERAWGNKP